MTNRNTPYAFVSTCNLTQLTTVL